MTRGRPVMDLAGRRFGRLVALRRASADREQPTRWRCRCDCGVEKEVLAGELRRGRVLSCGCLIALSAPYRSRKHVNGGC